MAKRNKVYRTAQGRSVDFGALLLANENEPALGNMNVNARGDQINSDGEIVKSREEIMKEDTDKSSDTYGKMIGTGKFQLTETGSGAVMAVMEGFLASADKDREELAKLRDQMRLLITKIDPDTLATG